MRSALIILDALAFSDRGKILEDQLVASSRPKKLGHEFLFQFVRGRRDHESFQRIVDTTHPVELIFLNPRDLNKDRRVISPELIALVADEDLIRIFVGKAVRFDHTDSLVPVVGQQLLVLVLSWTTVDNDDDFSIVLSIAHGQQIAEPRFALTRS